MLSATSNPPLLMNELFLAKQRLQNVRASLLQACRDIDLQIGTLDSLCGGAPENGEARTLTPQMVSLFECPPANVQHGAVAEFVPASSMVIKAAAPAPLDPRLEQATLEELNSALSKAFSQIAGRMQW